MIGKDAGDAWCDFASIELDCRQCLPASTIGGSVHQASVAAATEISELDKCWCSGEMDEGRGEACSGSKELFIFLGSDRCIAVPNSVFVSLGIEVRVFNIATRA